MLRRCAICPTQWFLEREAGGVGARPPVGQGFGQVVHALADRVAEGELEPARRPRRADGARRRGLGPAPVPHAVVEGRASTSEVRGGARPVPAWHAANAREVVGDRAARSAPRSSSPTASGSGSTGYADRLELDADGRVVVVDLKTGKHRADRHGGRRQPAARALPVAVEHGAVDDLRRRRRPVRRCRAGAARAARRRRRRQGAGARTAAATTTARAIERCAADGRAAASPRRELPGRRRHALPRLRLRAALPGQERRVGDRPVTADRRRIETPGRARRR